MKTRSCILKCSAAALVGLAPLAYMAPAAAVEGYVTQRYNNDTPVRTRYGECVHDGYWQPGMRYADCEPAPIQPVATPAPAPVVQQPVVEAPAPAPVPHDVPIRLSSETFFAFDKAVLTPEGQAALDDITGRLAVTTFDTLTVVGHADRIGPAAYNQKLSERRARAMADYLVAKGVDAQQIETIGLGQQNPSAQCPGLRGARLISCLQPDRYAELTVSGTVHASAN
jgi:OOP family OmpA-OmpF porin